MRVRSIVVLGLFATAALVVSGCGGDDDAASSSIEVASSPSLSKARYIKRAEEACGEARSDLFELSAKSTSEDDSASGRDQDPNYYAALEKEVTAVEALGAPEGDEDDVEAMLTAKQEAIEAASQSPELSQAETEELFAQANREMRDYGLELCLLGSAG